MASKEIKKVKAGKVAKKTSTSAPITAVKVSKEVKKVVAKKPVKEESSSDDDDNSSEDEAPKKTAPAKVT
ncbi:hypothetical protein HK100_010438 [Physocladia obscura]|uniref:Uncharacterized protein n=1 Tax=Physocladia obscura TaxID=109957 RepID=A0AAD5XH57_9FUNG|nr:hypothetical protein HK100_010438 [Physocladia obscura]